MRKLGIYLGLLVALFLVVQLLWHTPLQRGGEASPVDRTVAVVDVRTGAPVDDASVVRLDPAGEQVGSALPVDRGGRVRLSVASPRLLRVTAVGYHARTLAIGRDDSLTVPLAPETDGSVTVRLAGAVSMDSTVLPPDAPAESPAPDGLPVSEEQRLLASVAPLLGNADVTYADLATALVEDPVAVLDAGAVNTAKRTLRVSPTAMATALDRAGVDVVNLANNHVNDALAPGLESTIAALDEAGIAHAGAGASIDAAWAPAYVDTGDQVVAFLGCTTMTGGALAVPFVATEDQGGAARCEATRLAREVAAAAAVADDVVVTVHGGPAGPPTRPDALASQAEVRRLAAVAGRSGATLVVGGAALTVREVTEVAGVPFVESTGPLLDGTQTWRSRVGTLVTASVADGTVRGLIADPVALLAGRPVPVVGSVADATARALAGPSSGLLALGDQTASWPRSGGPVTDQREGAAESVQALGLAWWPQARPADARVGQDLLWGTGSMEDLETDPASNGSTLWDLGKYVTTSMEAGCHGVQGMRLRRGPLSEKDVVISPAYRQPVLPGTQLTLTANVLMASEGASLEVRWYRTLDPSRRSAGSASVTIDPKRLAAPCTPVRLDLVVPEGMVAAQPYVRLSPRHDVNLAAELRVDDVRLIAWDDGDLPDRAADTLEHLVAGAVEVRRDGPGAAG